MSPDDPCASLGELATLAAKTERAERLILAAALERLAAIDGDGHAAGERLVLERVVKKARAVLGDGHYGDKGAQSGV
ncbi:hypothetical protein [Azotobacter beijerinckii]|uniref:hypothetical protein n=1 Tax=Azotobacter beijerinckii TaxID=170623 RepID=UPI002954D717|nr:hypothetical protein [Azotobacter beijerinckii]MDV7213758.1 hypothetical protein [Azotobacter beijerinckii]